jgi:hypothetical protein
MRALLLILKFAFCAHQDDYYEHYPSESLTWSQAKIFCEEKGGALAT